MVSRTHCGLNAGWGMGATAALVDPGVQIDIWSDVVCPWCYIGKRRLEQALAQFPYADQVRIRWHSFQLDPAAAAFDPDRRPQDVASSLGEKYGGGRAAGLAMVERVVQVAAGDGLILRLDTAVAANTRDAHRLLHAALESGPAVQGALKERLLEAHFGRGLDVSDPRVLHATAVQAGLPAETASAVLSGRAHEEQVEADLDLARAYGATGVPFFVFDERFALSGAQPVALFSQVLDRAWERRGELAAR